MKLNKKPAPKHETKKPVILPEDFNFSRKYENYCRYVKIDLLD